MRALRCLTLVLALAAFVTFCEAGYLYADASTQLGNEYGIIKWDPDEQQAPPKIIVQLDIVDLGDGYYNGGCMDPVNGIGYMILGNGTSAGPYELISVDLATGKYTGPTKFTLPSPAINEWWVFSSSMGIITAIYAKDVLNIVGINPSSFKVSPIASISLKLDYYPGNIALDPTGNILYFPVQDHSTTTLYAVNCTSGKTSTFTFPKGSNIEEVVWDSQNQRLVALNVTYAWVGPIPTDPMDHIVTIDVNNNYATQQFGLPNQSLSHMIAGAVATNGTMYWHAVLQPGPGSLDHVLSWDLSANTFAVQNLLQFAQPQSWMAYMEN